MFRTIFTTLRALLKSGLCGTQLCTRSDTASYKVSIPKRLHHLPWLPSINRSMIAVLQNGRQALICPNYSDLSGSTAPKSLVVFFLFSNLLFQALVLGIMGQMSWRRRIHTYLWFMWENCFKCQLPQTTYCKVKFCLYFI